MSRYLFPVAAACRCAKKEAVLKDLTKLKRKHLRWSSVVNLNQCYKPKAFKTFF